MQRGAAAPVPTARSERDAVGEAERDAGEEADAGARAREERCGGEQSGGVWSRRSEMRDVVGSDAMGPAERDAGRCGCRMRCRLNGYGKTDDVEALEAENSR
ncbi:Os03g0427500 [Oryza sativa Japonica Group]|nr:Os03g0427500 [Oryza sativa Japonica Group]